MSKYTYKDVIIDPTSEEANNCIGKEAYFADSKKEENNPFGTVPQSNPFAQGQSNEFKPVTDDDLPFWGD